jgi:NADPH:quinone reductase-like Zn-dependent oxidoreductase
MRQIWIPKTGAPAVLDVREAADPTPGPGEVRVRVEAAGVNFADLMARMGIYPDAPPLPAVVGYEVAGTIDAVGAGVESARLGQAVAAMTRFGGYATAVCVPDGQAVQRPAGMDAVTGAAIPVTGLTAWMMCEVIGRVRPGDRVLVHSAGGGVGLMALDLLRWRGATAIGTASAHKHPMLLERGYDQVIDYTTDDFGAVLRDQEGLDLIFDAVGGESWGKGLDLLRAGGRLIMFGMSSNAQGSTRRLLPMLQNVRQIPWTRLMPTWLINHNVGVVGVNMGRLWHEGDRVAGWLRELFDLWEAGHLRPVVHATVPFDTPGEAHRILHDRENLGKVVLVP